MKKIIALSTFAVFTFGNAQETPKKDCCVGKDKKECKMDHKKMNGKSCDTHGKSCDMKGKTADHKECKMDAKNGKKDCCASKSTKKAA